MHAPSAEPSPAPSQKPDTAEFRRVSQHLSDHVARTEAWMCEALEGARMLGWEFDLVSNRWSASADVTDYFGLPPGPDYGAPEHSFTVIHPDDLGAVQAKVQRAMETGEPLRYEFRGRVPLPDGSPRWFLTRGRVLPGSSGAAVRLVGVTTDITESKRAEEARAALDRQLLDAQKWESLGVLAGGVAHDFNNILTVILGSASLARRGLPPGGPTVAHLDQIEQASRRAADLCRQLLAYTGRGHVHAGNTDLNALVRSTAALIGVPASDATVVKLDLGDGVPAVRADPAQVRQVLVNLAMNAAEAVGDAPGEVRVATRLVAVGPDAPGYHLAPLPGRYVSLAVTDTGPGIPPAVRAQMFDPFFTTKFAGRGLGLSAVLGIMRLHGGAVRVDAAPGRTTVEVLWPIAAVAPEPPPAAPEPPPAPAPRAPKALVVDDEIYVRELAASALQELGYEVLLAGDGAAAVALFQKHRGEVGVAVLDVMMPGATGDIVLRALRALEPGLPAVIVSGFTDRRTIPTGPGTRTEFVQKPFHAEELVAAIERVLAVGA